MKLKSDFTVEKLAGKDVLMPEGTNVLNGSSIFALNDSAKWYFEQLKTDKSFEELAALAWKKFGAENQQEKDTIENDLKRFLETLHQKNLLED